MAGWPRSLNTILTTRTLTNCSFTISDFDKMKQKVLNWAQRFNTFCFLDNHQYAIEPHTMECLLGAGVKRQIKTETGNALVQLQQFLDENPCWYFGHLGYDLKNEIEDLSSSHMDRINFPDLFFFEPEVLIRLNKNEMTIEAEDAEKVFAEVSDTSHVSDTLNENQVYIQNRLTQKEYIEIISRLKQHILRGDCYEINFCQEFFAENVLIDPVTIFKKLSSISPNPFSALYKVNDQWLICASPERYIKKQGIRILSQPIKGTTKRVTADAEKDKQSRNELSHSAKDRSENVMVVDLVRNDLAKICKEGTVQVDELYGIYSFPQVHQMISTVSGELKDNVSFQETIKATFPMGSMTGAPKKRVMELIEQYEKIKRGIFSGAVGYISPDGDFDLNVVIRSIMYNAATEYISFQAGSGITFYSDPEKEWEECLLKAEVLKRVLED